jgi:hypothetical protein
MEAFAVRFLRFAATATVSATSPFYKPLYLHSRQSLVMVYHLVNFLNPLKLFLGCGKLFHEIVMTENGGGKERKVKVGLATAKQVRDRWKS